MSDPAVFRLTLVAAVLTLGVVLYDVAWRSRPRMRLRIWKSRQVDLFRLLFINRGGSAYTVVGITFHFEEGKSRELVPDKGLFPVPAHGAVIRTTALSTNGGEDEELDISSIEVIEVEFVPMGVRWFPVPQGGWGKPNVGWLGKVWRALRRGGHRSRQVTREYRGYRRREDIPAEPSLFR